MVVAKEVGNPFNLIDITRKDAWDFSDIMAGNTKVFLGHNRAATRGTVKRNNSHPFLFESVMGMHNGTLIPSSQYKLTHHKKFDTDSEAIIAELETEGVEATIPKLEGAYALVWYDSRDNTVNFIRNKERSLYYIFDEDEKQLFWSSEWEHLASATNQIKMKDKGLRLLPENMHLSWTVPNSNEKFGEPTTVKREGFVPVPFTRGSNIYGDEWDEATKGWKPKKDQTGNNIKHTYHSSNSNKSGHSGITDEFPHFDQTLHMYKKWDGKRNNGCWVYSETYGGDYVPLFEAHERKDVKALLEGDKKTELVIVPENPLPVTNDMALYKENLKERRFQSVAGEVLTNKFPVIFKADNVKVIFNTKDKSYITYKFEGFKPEEGWIREETKICPMIVPFTMMDISARHEFKHKKHGKNKIPMYKGFKGDLLVQASFEALMKSGCMECDRIPVWGNKVQFLSHKEFLCEHCIRDSELVSGWKQVVNGV